MRIRQSRTIHEELGCIARLQRFDARPRGGRHRKQRVRLFPRQSQGFATRSDDAQLGPDREEAIRELGLLSLEPVDVRGMKVVPRDVVVAAIGPKLKKPDGRDLVALRVLVSGTKNGTPRTLSWELIDRYDERHGISAMMRTTGYSLSITGQMQARGEITPAGVHTPDECVPPQRYIDELEKRGIRIASRDEGPGMAD